MVEPPEMNAEKYHGKASITWCSQRRRETKRRSQRFNARLRGLAQDDYMIPHGTPRQRRWRSSVESVDII